jgi:hypothetical protein
MKSIDWATGLFEGEGCITTQNSGPVLQLRMADKDVVEQFVEVMGYGNIIPEKPAQPHHKPTWRWRVAKLSEVRRMLSMMLPLLGERRAYKALNALDDIEL